MDFSFHSGNTAEGMLIHQPMELKLVKQPKEFWWDRWKKAHFERKKNYEWEYESYPTWIACRAIRRRYSLVSFPLFFLLLWASWRMVTKAGLGFGVDANARIGNNMITVFIVWFILALILIWIFKSFALSSYSKNFRQEARNLMDRTSDPDPEKRWNTRRLVGHLGRQLAYVPQDGEILMEIIQLEKYSLRALVGAAEIAKERDVLQAILRFQKQDALVNSALMVVSALLSGIVSMWLLVLMKHFQGNDPMVLVAAGYCVLSVIVLVLAFQRGLDPEKWIGATGRLFIFIAVLLLFGLGAINNIDVVRVPLKLSAVEVEGIPLVQPKTPAK